jgi:sporulation protein YlmC with PRC-barrel domain
MTDLPTTTQYAIGAEVHCTDDACGHLDRVVIDPVTSTLTHIVVNPGSGTPRLVPVDLVDNTFRSREGSTGDVRLRCGTADFEKLDPAEETEFLPADEERFGYLPDQMIMWPYFGLGAGSASGAIGVGTPGIPPVGAEPHRVTYDRVPSGEVQIRRGERVAATDGEIGKVQGLIIDPADHGVTHVLLQEGHLWGKKTVAVPIRTVSYADGNVQVDLSKAELGDLPPVDVSRA